MNKKQDKDLLIKHSLSAVSPVIYQFCEDAYSQRVDTVHHGESQLPTAPTPQAHCTSTQNTVCTAVYQIN